MGADTNVRSCLESHDKLKHIGHYLDVSCLGVGSCEESHPPPKALIKIEGPGLEIMEKLIEEGLADHPFRRSWIGFFRIMTDDNQVRQLDRWIARQISSFVWRAHRVKVTRTDMRDAGLPTLYATMWKARRPPRSF